MANDPYMSTVKVLTRPSAEQELELAIIRATSTQKLGNRRHKYELAVDADSKRKIVKRTLISGGSLGAIARKSTQIPTQ